MLGEMFNNKVRAAMSEIAASVQWVANFIIFLNLDRGEKNSPSLTFFYPAKPTVKTATAPSNAKIVNTSPALGLPFQE